MGLSDWPPSERPREKLLRNGARSLTDGELLAVLLGQGTANEDALELSHRLLRACGDLSRVLTASPANLRQAPGLGPARVARIKAALETGRRHLEAPVPHRSALSAPEDAVRFFRARLADCPRGVQLPVPRHATPVDPLRRAVSRHRGRRRGVSTRGPEACTASQCRGRHLRAQSPVRRLRTQ